MRKPAVTTIDFAACLLLTALILYHFKRLSTLALWVLCSSLKCGVSFGAAAFSVAVFKLLPELALGRR
jgi:hypothetical protein